MSIFAGIIEYCVARHTAQRWPAFKRRYGFTRTRVGTSLPNKTRLERDLMMVPSKKTLDRDKVCSNPLRTQRHRRQRIFSLFLNPDDSQTWRLSFDFLFYSFPWGRLILSYCLAHGKLRSTRRRSSSFLKRFPCGTHFHPDRVPDAQLNGTPWIRISSFYFLSLRSVSQFELRMKFSKMHGKYIRRTRLPSASCWLQ